MDTLSKNTSSKNTSFIKFESSLFSVGLLSRILTFSNFNAISNIYTKSINSPMKEVHFNLNSLSDDIKLSCTLEITESKIAYLEHIIDLLNSSGFDITEIKQTLEDYKNLELFLENVDEKFTLDSISKDEMREMFFDSRIDRESSFFVKQLLCVDLHNYYFDQLLSTTNNWEVIVEKR